MPTLTLNSLYTRVTEQAYTPSEYTSTKFLEDAHLITQDMWSEVVALRKAERNWDIWNTDTVALQDEYTIPFVDSVTV